MTLRLRSLLFMPVDVQAVSERLAWLEGVGRPLIFHRVKAMCCESTP